MRIKDTYVEVEFLLALSCLVHELVLQAPPGTRETLDAAHSVDHSQPKEPLARYLAWEHCTREQHT